MANIARKGIIGAAAALAMALVASLAGLVGCTDGHPHGVTGNTGEGPLARTNTSGIDSFSYSAVNAFGPGTYTATVKRADDGGVVVTYDIFGYQDLDQIEVPADESLLTQLEAIYADQHIARWNGFDRTDNDVLDGGGFSLRITFNDDSEFSAHGSNAYPDGFGDFHTAIEPLLKPYREQVLEAERKAAIARGTAGQLDGIMVNFTQHGTSGRDEYSFFLMPEGVRKNNCDITIRSSGEFFPEGKLRYLGALPNEAIWFDRVQELIDRHQVLQWHRWDKTAPDYNNAEWFQIDFTYSEDGEIDAMGTEHPEGYDQFRADFLQLMADMVRCAEQNYGLEAQ